MKKHIDIFTQHYCPFHIIVLGAVFLIISLFTVFMIPILGFVFLILGIILTTSHYRLVLVPANKKYREYLWIIGFQRGSVQDYDKVEYLFINKVEQNAEYGLIARLSVRKKLYQAYLKFSNGEKVYLGESIREKNAIDKATKIADVLEVSVKKNYGN